MQNRVVVHTADGRIFKGTTADFFPNKELFHLGEEGTGATHDIQVAALKAVYFVKTFEGRRDYQERADTERVGCGRKIKICFSDGETQFGYTQGYAPNRTGFFVFPVDPESNNERIYVVTAATTRIEFV
jgi:hypothetical protein